MKNEIKVKKDSIIFNGTFMRTDRFISKELPKINNFILEGNEYKIVNDEVISKDKSMKIDQFITTHLKGDTDEKLLKESINNYNNTMKETMKGKVKNWKYDLFNFKNSLTLDQYEISTIVEKHLYQFDKMSEKELTESLKMNLSTFSYDTDVKRILESFEEELDEKPLVYNLKDLYKKVERRNHGMLYRDPLQKILDTIAKDNDELRMESIVNDLSIYDWVPEIKVFVSNMLQSPIEKQNYNSDGAVSEKVYTVVESVEDGHVAYIGDRWFKLKEGNIEQCVLFDQIKDSEKVKILEALEQAMKISDFNNEMINFRIDENLIISLGMDNRLYLNGTESDKDTSLEDVFNSPLVPFMSKNYYHVIEKVSNNLDKIVELDIATKITSMKRPLTETIALNYKDKMYIYNMDKRTGSSFFEYDSVNQLIQDIQRDMEYDVTPFFENKLSKEMQHYRKLEDQEQSVELKLKEVNESIDELKESSDLMKESEELKEAFDNLLIHKHNLTKSLNDIKNQKVTERKKL